MSDWSFTNFLRYALARVVLFSARKKRNLARKCSGRFSTIESSGVSICFSDEGRGPAVVLLHGIIGDASDWNPVIKVLKDRFRLIALDARGQGASGKPKAPAAYGREMIKDVHEVLRQLGIEKACFVGASAGAEIALRFVVDYPELVTRLVVIGSGWSGEKESTTYSKVGEVLKKHHSLAPWIRESGGEGYFSADYFGLATADLMLKGRDIDACAETFLGMRDIINLSEEDVRKIDIPVLAICGENDVERSNLEKLVGVVSDISFKLLLGRDHMDTDEDPEQMKSIEEFLSPELTLHRSS
ncbi:alpha/beta hydrolase [Myxococcota bacterium]|nr:alpha/beta hydrolase [Myxococcota bacterium]